MQRAAGGLNFEGLARFHLVPTHEEQRLSSLPDCPFVTRIYADRIPEFAEAALDALYGSLYSSLPQLQLSSLAGVHTYAAWQAGRLCTLFLYALRSREIRVVNEGMAVDEASSARFARAVFDRHPEAERIRFHAVACRGRPAGLPTACFTLTEDMVIELPTSEAAYLAALGKSTRKSLRQNMGRAKGLAHRVIPGDQVDASVVEAIIGFNHARMAMRQRASALDEVAARKLLALLRARGVVGVVTLDGTPCAGALTCRIGDDIYSLVNAHDPRHDALGMGTISRHLMILAAIRSGARRFHLMGGNIASKQSALAYRMPLDDLLIYRNDVARCRHGAALARLQLAEWEHQLRSAMEDQDLAQRAGWPMRCALAVAQWWKEVRRGKPPSPHSPRTAS